jgi:hypothetical protein
MITGSRMTPGTVLVVVTTDAEDSTAIADWLRPQLATDEVIRVTGFYAAMSLLERRPRAVVVDVGAEQGRHDWRLAELRGRAPGAAFVVVADAAHLAMLAGAIRADLAVTSAGRLPPLRELLLTDEPIVADQTSWRRSRR